MPNTNKNLNRAKGAKNDEFYTQLPDIENELQYYTNNFKDKIVYCNCDNPQYSNFYKYFKNNFDILGLKKLICSYIGKTASVTEYKNGHEITYPLKSGDFRSLECIELLKEADIVVTNPPFSLFREFIELMINFDKQFLVIGNMSAVKYKTIFPLFVENKMVIGVNCGEKYFKTPSEYSNNESVIIDGIHYVKHRNTRWFTNMPYSFEKHITYSDVQVKYQKYDAYDAIEISRITSIPKYYDGVMGVPITFMDKFNPNQFEIIGELNHGCDNKYDFAKPVLNGKELFTRILIRRKLT